MKNNSISVKLSLKYMILVALVTVLICTVFTGSLFFYAKKIRSDSLKSASQKIVNTISKDGIEELDFIDFSYFIEASVFTKENKEILFTTNNLIPLFDFKSNKVSEYFEKDYYSDSDLRLSVLSRELTYKNQTIIVQCAIDIENDSLSKMIKGFPKILVLCFVPILALSFLISYLISKKTITAFKKLESAFENEKAFSSNVSHELKTPLSIIDGHANLIKRWGNKNPQQLENSVNIILEETENMSKIVNTLLELSKIENGLMEIQKSRFYVSNLFAKLRDEFTSVNENLQIKIQDNDFVEIYSDEKMLHQILTAIISNSIKFSKNSAQAKKDCKILLKTSRKNDRVFIEVEDNGPGFAPEILPYIFERFYKGDKSHTRNGAGSGLGLSIAKSLVAALNGKISAENIKTGGARIILEF